jgi:ACS family sodium-dependent inorganic phosphate cotransporter-like MFS transporter 5
MINKVFGTCICGEAIVSMLIPWMCNTGGITLLIIARVIQGVFSGLAFPSINAVYSSWAPPLERSRFASIGISGKNLNIGIFLNFLYI